MRRSVKCLMWDLPVVLVFLVGGLVALCWVWGGGGFGGPGAGYRDEIGGRGPPDRG